MIVEQKISNFFQKTSLDQQLTYQDQLLRTYGLLQMHHDLLLFLKGLQLTHQDQLLRT